jgi:hypothetical protein
MLSQAEIGLVKIDENMADADRNIRDDSKSNGAPS